MGEMFRRVVVIGYGKATGNILKYIEEQKAVYGYSLEFIEHESHALSVTKKICEEMGIPYANMPDKQELAGYLCDIREKTLIVSASNNFLFRQPVWRRRILPSSISTMRFYQTIRAEMHPAGSSTWEKKRQVLPGIM